MSATITDVRDRLICLSIGYRKNNKAVGAVLILRNEDGVLIRNSQVIKPASGSLEKCLTSLPMNNYTLNVYDLETTPFILNDEVPAVIIPSISIRGEMTSSSIGISSTHSFEQSSITDIVTSSWSASESMCYENYSL